MKNRGVTLVELLVVISIIGVLVVVLGFSYQGWMGRYKVESNIKTLYSDLLEARGRAMQMNRVYFAVLNADRTRIIEDTNGNGLVDAHPTDLVIMWRSLAPVPQPLPPTPSIPWAKLDYNYGPVANLGTYTLDNRGLITLPVAAASATIRLVLPGEGTPDAVTPDYDCVVIKQTQIKLGLITPPGPGGVCVEK